MFQTSVFSFGLFSYNDDINIVMPVKKPHLLANKLNWRISVGEFSESVFFLWIQYLVLNPGRDLQWTTLANRSKSILKIVITRVSAVDWSGG